MNRLDHDGSCRQPEHAAGLDRRQRQQRDRAVHARARRAGPPAMRLLQIETRRHSIDLWAPIGSARG
jgi:hypothetical protein